VRGAIDQNPYTYTGREYDPETGLYYYRARYYDPATGRFLQQDPIGFASGDVNLYGYVGNNPINFIDPSGLIHYNKKPPWTVPVQGQTLLALQCVERCLRDKTGNCSLDLLITGGAEKSGHSPNSAHYNAGAVDIAGPQFNPVTGANVMSCAVSCGFGAGQFENFPNNPNRNHWHLQLHPGDGVPPIP
jgi:RHS repeat-associated protein